jgi:hypothetical protein
MKLATGRYELELLDEPTYTSRSADNLRSYAREYVFGDAITSRHGVLLRQAGGGEHSCMVSASGGVTAVHEHSAVIVESCSFLAVGDTVCALALPSLELLWRRKVDTATCFGIYYSAEEDCLFSHGECEIARLTLSGERVWSAIGADIFTEGFALHADYLEAVDFNRFVYRIDVKTGNCRRVA